MQVSKSSIDDEIAHELCHLIKHNHTKQFCTLLDRLMPDWRLRRTTLNAHEFN